MKKPYRLWAILETNDKDYYQFLMAFNTRKEAREFRNKYQTFCENSDIDYNYKCYVVPYYTTWIFY